MRIDLKKGSVECLVGDITDQADVEAVVNAANAQLMPGGGVAGAIHRRAGPELAEACRPLAPIAPGQAVLTPGFGMPNAHIIHCLGPVYGVDTPSAELLAQCYRAAIELADARGIASIAFPAISTGAFGYPVDEAAPVACEAAIRALADSRKVRLVRHVLADRAACELYESESRAAAGNVFTGPAS
ncbi:macro domain-containing protein [Fodinicurvata sp. EGI_FJ10296]|uniref:macro domain-containing protein n=1 Tax=Fodinicurvata sp. EGI_FJ10296 TaxID=3231908 RepID=UPI003456C81F